MGCSNYYSIFAWLMLRSVTWPFFEINGHTVTVGQILAVSIFAWLRNVFICLHMIYLPVLWRSHISFAIHSVRWKFPEQPGFPCCPAAVTQEVLSRSYHTSWSLKIFPPLLLYANRVQTFYFRLTSRITIVPIIILFDGIINSFYLNSNVCLEY